MPQRRIATEIEDAPELLREILLDLLRGIPGVVAHPFVAEGAPRPDALLRVSDRPEDLPPGRGDIFTVSVAEGGDRMVIHRPGEPPHHLRNTDTASLRAALMGWPVRRGWRQRFGRSTAVPPPEAMGPTPSAPGLGYLAGKALQCRGPYLQSDGPEGELLFLLDRLGAHPHPPPESLGRLAQRFGLTMEAAELLLLVALAEADPVAARMVALLNDHLDRPRPTVATASMLGLDPGALADALAPTAALRRFRLIEATGDAPISLRPLRTDRPVWQALLRPPPLDAEVPTADPEASAVLGSGPLPPAIAVLGPEDSGRERLVQAIAAARSLPVAETAASDPMTAVTISEAIRDAALQGRIPVLRLPVPMPELPPDLVGWPVPTIVFLAPAEAFPALARAIGPGLLDIRVPERTRHKRAAEWRRQLPAAWPPQVAEHLAARFDFGPKAIGRATALATARARADGRDAALSGDLRAACAELREAEFDGAAEELPCVFAPDDIVLPPATRAELDLAIAWDGHGARLFAADGPAGHLHAGEGLACLFTGPPGTGKTMAAQIVARQVDRALFRIDLSQVVDKFIGESEKRLAKVFDAAERARVALFFDEADALFGKRTEVRDSHDRYANITVDYLLQRIEGFRGMAILATNFAGNIDDAFMRRMRVRAEFPVPEPRDRCRIWEKLLPPPGDRAGDIDIRLLAEPYDLVGGEIRNTIYTAHLLAAAEGAPLSMRHCVRAMWRELSKIGRVAERAHLGPWAEVIGQNDAA